MRINGRLPGASTAANVSMPMLLSTQDTGLTSGSSMNSQTRTLATPARAPGM